jgi:anti-anti-sigma factor
MNVTTLSDPSVTGVELEGSIDGKTAPHIREELSAALQEVRKLIIDMSRVDY